MGRFKGVVVWGVCLLLAAALPGAWTVKRITNNAGESENPAIATNGSNIFVAWDDDTPGNGEIYFRRSVDGGATWQNAKRLTNNEGFSGYPDIAANGQNVYVVWQNGDSGNENVYFRKSPDGGATWNAAKRLTFDSGPADRPAVAVIGANVYVAWRDDSSGNTETYIVRSTDGGVTWKSAMRLSNSPLDSSTLAIAVNTSYVYVVWDKVAADDTAIFFRRSADNGATWQAVQQITNNTGGSWTPSLAANGAELQLAWDDDTAGNFDIYFKKSTNRGGTWQTQKRISNNSGSSRNTALAVANGNVVVAWNDQTPGNNEIYFRKSADGGATWLAAQRLTNNTGYSTNPDVATNSSNVYVVYYDNTPGNYEIYLKYSPL